MGFDHLVFLVGRARHPGPTSLPSHFGVEFLNVGGWLTNGDFAPKVGVDFLAVAEHRLIPAPGLRGKGSLLFGLLPLRIPPMLVMLLECGVLLLLFLPLLLPSFRGSSIAVGWFGA